MGLTNFYSVLNDEDQGQKLGLDKQGEHSSSGAGAASRILGPSFSVESELQRFSPLGLALIPHLPSSSRAAPHPPIPGLPTLPPPLGISLPWASIRSSPPQPAPPGSHCHFSEERRREAGKQPVFCPPTSPHARVRHCSPARAPHPPPTLIQTGLLPVCPLPLSPCVPHTFPRTASLTSSSTG